MANQFVSAAAYAQRVLTYPEQEAPAVLRQVLEFIATLAEGWTGCSLMTAIDVDDGWHFYDDDIPLADAIVDLSDRPEAVGQLAEALVAGKLAYDVAPWTASDDGSGVEPAIWVTSKTGGYVIAHIALHPRLGCLRVQIC
ncbi:hypothetical protein PRN20_05985 [Devosia sp. ZB163]|uniref:hypothetical protein n=1 Tax=Devosia sp. ZB163 TaxID=3025938 RepID=UPI002360D046|nr:hypothetical protein [Devosia sp. ZB163]MDC9823274.1 hypothetical protein [Devosia sp. ZB163]